MARTLLHTIGNTPVVELKELPRHFGVRSKIYAKLEFFNPGGSIKDRPALYMIKSAIEKFREKSKKLKKLVEPTSGNTGIALAMIGNVLGIKTILVMPENVSEERVKLLRLLGAETVLTPESKGMKGAIEKAIEIKETEKAFMPNQFENPENPKAHYETTGPEILSQVPEVDIFVAGVGTGGTLMGVGTFLKEKTPDTKIVAVEPASSPVLSRGKAGSHLIQGIGAGFVPKIVKRELINEIITVADEEALETTHLLAEKEGILSGISGGANICASLKIAKEKPREELTIVTVIPDSSFKYLSLLNI